MQIEPTRSMHTTPLRLWLLVFALLFSQWVFAGHDHTVDEVCLVCVVADHFDLVNPVVVDPHIPATTDLSFIKQRPAFVVRSYSSAAARAPPSLSTFS